MAVGNHQRSSGGSVPDIGRCVGQIERRCGGVPFARPRMTFAYSEKGTAVPKSGCAIDTSSHNLGMGQVTRAGRCGTNPSIRCEAVTHSAAGLDEGIARCQQRDGPRGPQILRS